MPHFGCPPQVLRVQGVKVHNLAHLAHLLTRSKGGDYVRLDLQWSKASMNARCAPSPPPWRPPSAAALRAACRAGHLPRAASLAGLRSGLLARRPMCVWEPAVPLGAGSSSQVVQTRE